MNRVRQTEASSASSLGITAPTLIQHSRSWPVIVQTAVVGGLALLSFLVGYATLFLANPGAGVAIWWPAVGVTALVYLLYRGPRWQVYLLVGSVGFLSNIAVGRPLSFALTGAVILIVELFVFVRVLGPQGPVALLSTMRGLGRFLLAVLAASVTIGFEGAVTLWWLAGINPLASFLSLIPSHASALLLIVPLALVPLPRVGDTATVTRKLEGAVQLSLMIAVSLLVFSPLLPVPMFFTLFPLLAWAASRFSPIFVVGELIVVALIVPTLTVATGGPFAGAQGAVNPDAIVQVFLLSAAITTLFLAVVRSERELLAEEKERRAALMRGGFLGSQVGFLVLRSSNAGELQVLESNDTAADLVRRGWLRDIVGDWMVAPSGDLNHELSLPDGRSWQVFGSLIPSARGERVAGMQLVDVSDHVSAREAMARAYERERTVADELRELSRQKDDFVSAVSHELRTPITSIIGFAEDLDEEVAPEARVMTEVIIRNSNRLAGMVEQLLELGRMTAPNPMRASGPISLNRIVTETVEEQGRIAHSADVAIEVRLDERRPDVTGDANSLSRVATNLLSNAIKFTPRGGKVTLTTAIDDNEALLTIDDSGVGISPADRERVFERFFRSSDDAKLSAPGTGLGLAIVRSLVELLGGTIEITDSPLGGARFAVRLPLADDDSERGSA